MRRPIAAFRDGLRDLGYHEGKNVMVDYRFVEGQYSSAPALVSDLVRRRVAVLVGATHGIEGTAVSNPHIDIARVKPIDLTAPAFRLGEGQVDLTRASDLSGPIGIGGAWQTPPYVALSDDPFDERYGAWATPAPTR